MSDRKVFKDSVTPLPDDTGITPNGMVVHAKSPENNQQKMTLLFSLAPSEKVMKSLEKRVAKGEVISPEELEKTYSPQPAEVEKLRHWLKSNGYKIIQESADKTSIYAENTVGKIEATLDVDMVRVTRDGVTYNAAKDAPSLPSDVGEGVHGIIGLQPFRQAHKHSRMLMPASGNRVTEEENGASGPTTNIQNAPPYLVSEILKAYNANGLSLTGAGQTIAILIDTLPKDADLKSFWHRNNLPTTLQQITKINVKGGTLPLPEGEETLDVEWASGIAPGAKIRIYASGSLAFVDLDRALDRIIADLPAHPGMRQLSISLGLGETFMSAAEVVTQHAKFLRLAAAGVNVFVSSGDAGSNPSASGHSSTGPRQAEYESSDISVIGVGGTRLLLNTSGTVSSETGWPGSGGGKSIFFGRPAWQTGAGVPGGSKRLVPDVSAVADPNTGAFLVFQGQTTQIGGTSWSAPVWAGFCALTNEARTKANKPPLPFLNPLLYPLMGTSAFRDIKSGSNGGFNAGPGYDMVTGIGVPNVKNLISALTH
jgi:kumamolisin